MTFSLKRPKSSSDWILSWFSFIAAELCSGSLSQIQNFLHNPEPAGLISTSSLSISLLPNLSVSFSIVSGSFRVGSSPMRLSLSFATSSSMSFISGYSWSTSWKCREDNEYRLQVVAARTEATLRASRVKRHISGEEIHIISRISKSETLPPNQLGEWRRTEATGKGTWRAWMERGVKLLPLEWHEFTAMPALAFG